MNKRGSIILYFIPFLADMVMGTVMISVPLLAIFLGASSVTLGFLGFVPGAVFVSLCFIFGKLSERYQRKNLLIFGLFFYILSSLVLCLTFRIYQLYISMAITGVAAAMFWPTLEAWIAEIKSKRPLARRMGAFNVSWSTGQTLGPLVGGVLFGVAMKLPFYFTLFVSLCGFFIFLWRGPKVTLSTTVEPLLKDFSPHLPLYTNLSRLANFTLWFSLGIIRYIFPKLGTSLGISPSFLGFLMFSLFLSQTLTFYGLGKVHSWHYTIFPLILFQALALTGLVIILMSSSLALFFPAFVCMGLGTGMTHTSSLFYSVNSPLQKGPRAAIHETILGVGALLGPLVGGIVAQNFSLRAPYLMAALVVGTGMIAQILVSVRYGHSTRL
ncbi:MFS transporter [Candidatus Aerophobetes bacterium]|nr:MFS transporter [Candidatus Aerophobetes bacterium]